MKATNVPVKEKKEKKVTPKVTPADPLITMDALTPHFGDVKLKITQYSQMAADLVVDSDDALLVAENNSGLINDTLKKIDEVRKTVKDPYYRSVKLIDEYAKTLTAPLNEAKQTVNNEITNYKVVQEATKKAEAEAIKKKAEALATEKAEEADKINRIETQINARIYGGYWFNRDNQKKSSAGCHTKSDCDKLRKIINENIPKVKEFTHMKKEYEEMVRVAKKNLGFHSVNLIEASSESPIIKEKALKAIEVEKKAAGVRSVENKEEAENKIIKEAKSSFRTAEKEVKEAGKGVRKNLNFKVSDINDVPENWLKLDDAAVKEWVADNKDHLKKELQEGRNIHLGVEFYLTESYVTR